MDKVQLFIDVKKKRALPFKIVVNDKVLEELILPDEEDRTLNFRILLPYSGTKIELVFCEDDGKRPMFVSDNTLIGVEDEGDGVYRLDFNEPTPEVE